jgi:hypothetical protein
VKPLEWDELIEDALVEEFSHLPQPINGDPTRVRRQLLRQDPEHSFLSCQHRLHRPSTNRGVPGVLMGPDPGPCPECKGDDSKLLFCYRDPLVPSLAALSPDAVHLESGSDLGSGEAYRVYEGKDFVTNVYFHGRGQDRYFDYTGPERLDTAKRFSIQVFHHETSGQRPTVDYDEKALFYRIYDAERRFCGNFWAVAPQPTITRSGHGKP